MKKPEPPPSLNGSQSDFAKAMDQLYKDRQLLPLLAEAQKDYPYWEKFKRRVEPMNVAPAQLWRLVKQQRLSTAQQIVVHQTPDFLFHYNLTSSMQETLHKLDMQLGGAVGSMNTIPEGTQQQLLTSSLMEEAIASSQLEGAATSRMVAKEMLRSQREPRDKSERMILNNYLTMRYLVDRKNEPMSVERLMAIHRMVVQGTLDDEEDEGNARTNNDVRVVDHVSGDVLYEPPSHERIQELLRAVCSFANDGPNDPFVHPVIRGIILHFLIGYVHPFVDGNGRTARALFYWYLLRKGYWLVEFLSISKVILRAPVQYARAYLHTEQDGNDLTYFVLFGLRSMDLARHDLDQYLQRKLHERRSLFKFVTAAPINDRQTELVALWVREPERSLSIRDVQARFDISYQTARADLLGLAALGLLRSRKSVGKRLAFFQAPEMETILASMRASK